MNEIRIINRPSAYIAVHLRDGVEVERQEAIFRQATGVWFPSVASVDDFVARVRREAADVGEKASPFDRD